MIANSEMSLAKLYISQTDLAQSYLSTDLSYDANVYCTYSIELLGFYPSIAVH
jgi:hypothetical protein